MNKLAVIHYYPIDYFPPVMNLIESLQDKICLFVVTTEKANALEEYKSKNCRIYRPIKDNKKVGSLAVLIRYFYFTLVALFLLIREKPDKILYYESISALAPYIYKYFFNKKVKLCIHYHEYMTPAEYRRPGMRLSNICHKLEISKLYKHAIWISHTNKYRIKLFLEDYPFISKKICYILPNFPPKKWFREYKVHKGEIIKCVYVGSLSLTDTFVFDFCRWIVKQNGKVQFDIYSFNFHDDTILAIESLNSNFIKFHKEGIKYSDIPLLFERYDVGVLLYKAQTLNVKYCETNKFYEYLICGLDVWYPKEMTLLHEMDKNIFAPNIIEMDITNGIFPDLDFSARNVCNTSYDRFCENVYETFL